MKNILLLSGGGSTEHEITFLSAEYIKSKIDESCFKVFAVVIEKDGNWTLAGKPCELNFQKELICGDEVHAIDTALPCLHGFPGETGDIQSYFELIKLPYFGNTSETSVLCFNKLATKLMLEFSGIKTSPFLSLVDTGTSEIAKAYDFLKEHKAIYVKATNQGSSVGCYRVENKNDLEKTIKEAFEYSPFVIIEKEIKGREIEVAVFEFNKKVHATVPGEIECEGFYTYEEKYSDESNTTTQVEAKDIPQATIKKIQEQTIKAFHTMKLRHLSRVDYFITSDNEVYLNEINTFPGHTSISMFPMMMENYGVSYSDFINEKLQALSN